MRSASPAASAATDTAQRLRYLTADCSEAGCTVGNMLLPTITMFAPILQFQRALSPAMLAALEHHRRLRQAMPETLMMALHAGRYVPAPVPELVFKPVMSEARVTGMSTDARSAKGASLRYSFPGTPPEPKRVPSCW